MIDSTPRTIYLSGPMTGLPQFNYPKFTRVAAALRHAGWTVYNPAEFPHFGAPEKFPIRHAMAFYCNCICHVCDTVVMLNGWEASKGATIEHLLAVYCKREIWYYPKDFWTADCEASSHVD